MPGKLGEPALNRYAYEATLRDFLELCTEDGIYMPDYRAEKLVRRLLRMYLKLNKDQNRNEKRLAAETYTLIGMAIGQTIVFEPCAKSVMRNRMKTARDRLNNPGARWSLTFNSDGKLECTRLEDYQPYRYNPTLNRNAVWLANIPKGQTRTTKKWKNRQTLGSNMKVAARRILQNDKANWSARTTAEGIKVTRTT